MIMMKTIAMITIIFKMTCIINIIIFWCNTNRKETKLSILAVN